MSDQADISISYVWDKETYLKASESAYKYELKNSNKKYFGWLFIAMTQFGVVAAMKKEAIGLLLISTILVIYWYGLRWPIRKWMLNRSFQTFTGANHTFEINASEDGLIIDSNYFEWEKINKAVSTKKGFLIYLENNFIFVPIHAFSSIEEKNQFSTLLKNHTIQYQRDE